MGLPAGKLRHRVRLEDLVVLGRGDQGEDITDWALVATVWAAIEPISAREFIQSAAQQSAVSARITIRRRSDVSATCRIVHGTKIYNVEGVLPDKESGLEYMTLPVSEGLQNTPADSVTGIDGGEASSTGTAFVDGGGA